MKLKILVLFSVFILAFGCSRSDSVDSSTSGSSSVKELTISQNGDLSYDGSGEFAGFSIEINNSNLPGAKVRIEKKDAPGSKEGYQALSDAYVITLPDLSGKNLTASIKLPYNETLFRRAGISENRIALLTLKGDSLNTSYTQQSGNDNIITGYTYFPSTVYAGYKKEVVLPEEKSFIKLKSYSYNSAVNAGDFFLDNASSEIYDTVGGIPNVQPYARVLLSIDESALSASLVSADWSIVSKPSGSSASLQSTGIGNEMQLIPEEFGKYEISADVTLADGSSKLQKITINATGYSFNSETGNFVCDSQCHNGSLGTWKDKYGRNILRDILGVWRSSAHGTAFQSVSTETDTLCFDCHTTGYFYPDRNHNGEDDFPKAFGYDDLMSDWTTPAANQGNSHLRGVTCEACHGPSYVYDNGVNNGTFAAHPQSFSLDSGVCLKCHGSVSQASGHVFKYKDVHDQSHKVTGDTSVIQNKKCFSCHTGQGYMSKLENADTSAADFKKISGIGCPVCHDPHGGTGNDYQLRESGQFTINLDSGDKDVDAGIAAMCYDCHSSGLSLPEVGAKPHNTQAEMLEAAGGYEYGGIDNSSAHFYTTDKCVGCHMMTLAKSSFDNVTNHEFSMQYSVSKRIQRCNSSCHGTTGFNIPTDYDYKGRLTEISSMLADLKSEINTKAGLQSGTAVMSDYSSQALSAGLTDALNKAAYNYFFVKNDRSSGAHNYNYAKALLQASLDNLSGY